MLFSELNDIEMVGYMVKYISLHFHLRNGWVYVDIMDALSVLSCLRELVRCKGDNIVNCIVVLE
jgi:hypothetical protein